MYETKLGPFVRAGLCRVVEDEFCIHILRKTRYTCHGTQRVPVVA